jgi:hypothetical protein
MNYEVPVLVTKLLPPVLYTYLLITKEEYLCVEL